MKTNITLSDRLKAIADMVTVGNTVCDVGCDHGFVPIYLIKQKISPRVIAMDINEGPLKRAREHIKEYGADAYIETRLSDGLSVFTQGEADTLICAGMGGRLMMRILKEDADKTASFKELILQPQSELQQFRYFLRSQGYRIADENMIEEDGKFYPMMKAVKSENGSLTQWESLESGGNMAENGHGEAPWRQMEDRYGALLIQNRSEVLYRYLEKEKKNFDEILNKLGGNITAGSRKNGRYEEIEKQLRDCIRVMEVMDGNG